MSFTREEVLDIMAGHQSWLALAHLGVATTVGCVLSESGEPRWSVGCLRVPLREAFEVPIQDPSFNSALARLAAYAIERGWFTDDEWRTTLATI
jgi:hypothetical protein